ncbi:MAG: FHA domain-containing protein [Acidobacteria bacterium]|nr:FHA domain-containing protein [Acidobacteriota bacterium]
MSKFLIIRKDINLDPVEIESEGLTIGRLSGNDLALNHPTVSRTHAGIKEINGDYWIFNLSEANGTLLNGELIEQTPLADGDLIQIGPFFLYPKYISEGLQFDVEMSVKPLPIEASSFSQLQLPIEQRKTIRLDLSQLAQLQREKTTPKGTRRLSGTGMLTGIMDPGDAQSLKVFWDKRMREAGKLSTDSPLMPVGKQRLGKAQFNWYPTRDLLRAWPGALFVWAALIVTVLALGATFAFTDAYSPGPISTPHSRGDLSMTPAIAKQANSATCTTCHSVSAPMNQNCASCHQTSAFHSDVSDVHMKVGLTCITCHSEHHGRSFRPAFVANVACTGCHRDGSGFISPLTKQPLKTPHGGTFGYPVTEGRWTWDGISQAEWARKDLPGSTSQFTPKEQFHLVHTGGRQQGRLNCTDCHSTGFEGAALRQGVRDACANCHGTRATQAETQASYARRAFAERAISLLGKSRAGGPLCVSCHSQHGEEKDLRASLRRQEIKIER